MFWRVHVKSRTKTAQNKMPQLQEQTQSAGPDLIGPPVQLVLWLLVVYAGGSYVCNKLADPSYGSALHSPLSFAGM